VTPDVQHRFRVGFSPCIAVISVLTIGREPAAKPRTHRLPGYSNIDQFCVEGNDIQLWEFASGEAREFRCTSAASHNEFVGIERELVMLWASDFHPRTLCRRIGPTAEGLYACIAIEVTHVPQEGATASSLCRCLCTTCVQECGFKGPEIGPKQRRINNRLLSYRLMQCNDCPLNGLQRLFQSFGPRFFAWSVQRIFHVISCQQSDFIVGPRLMGLGHSWGTIEGDSLVADRRHNKGLGNSTAA
jgi:hypothetical protein